MDGSPERCHSYIDTLKGQEKRLFGPAARREGANDWVLVLKKSTRGREGSGYEDN